MIVSIKDTAGFTAEGYGDGAALTNGMDICVCQGGETVSLTPHPIKTNAEWAFYTYDIMLINFDAAPTNQSMVVRWTFARMGAPIRLEGNAGDQIVVVAQDDLSHLIEHHYAFQGVIETTLD